MYGTNQNKVPISYSCNSGSTLLSVITEGTLEPCLLHLVLSTCLVVVAVNITKSKNIIGEGDKAQKSLP